MDCRYSKRPGLCKVRKFLKNNYPYKVVNNEWQVKFPIGKTPTGRVATYNPDFYCPTTDYFIEVTTSKGNIIQQGDKWRECIRLGHKLKVFYWDGRDFTNYFTENGNTERIPV